MIVEAMVETAIGFFGKKFIEALRTEKEQDAQNEIQRILGPGYYFIGKKQ